MSTNAQLATIFNEMAAVLELIGANPFRVNAHARVARVLKDLTVDVATLADEPKQLEAIEGIGKASAKKIAEFVATGAVAEHERLVGEVPGGLLALLEIPGLGPKTVKMLWDDGGVTDLASLKDAIARGALADLPRMGDKTIRNITESIAFAEQSGDRARLGIAMPLAESIVERLRAVPGAGRVQYTGSLRRGRETIGDIDILATAREPEKLAESFTTMPGVAKVLAAGRTKCSVRLEAGIQVDLRLVDEEAWGAALLYFSGSKEHNVALRERAGKRGARLNEYGLFPDDGDDAPPQQRGIAPIASRTEKEIYAALDLPWIPPELREDRGELTAQIPKLIELADIRADLHAHTVASDGKMTIDELAAAARDRGYHTVAVTDHSQASAVAGGLTVEDLLRHVDAVHEANERIDGITILAGSEVDILADGHLDYDDEVLARLDIVVASPHVALGQDPAKATRRLLTAIRHPLVHVIGHPTGRMVNRREGLHPDIEALVTAAAEHGTALEINANDMRLDLRDVHVRAAVEAGALISINTDAHTPGQLELMPYGVLTGRRGWLTADGCINAWPAKRLHAWLAENR
ncbi:MAG: DNA polymerase/3'-5' exonuclease PolX [Planctomycetes bacterium]|nr:DNA polymerase/3'-5' exonuclease PolX [Planctomycetota bacterium]